jgi:hypothetical protein
LHFEVGQYHERVKLVATTPAVLIELGQKRPSLVAEEQLLDPLIQSINQSTNQP